MSARIRGWVLLAAAVAVLPLAVWQGAAGCAEAGDDNVSACPTAHPYCGDGCVDAALGETCDDGNRIPGDGCDPSCHREFPVDAGDTTPEDDAGTMPDETVMPDETTTPEDTSRPEDTWIPDTTDTGSCPESPCRLWPQCGCPAGQKCTYDPDLTTETTLVKMCDTAGTGTTTSICTAESDCSAGTVCLAMSTEEPTPTLAMCFQYCAAQSDCAEAGSYCMALTSSSAFPGACSHACTPSTGSGCPTGSKCNLYVTAADEFITDCTSDVGTGTQDSYCSADGDCGRGTLCYTELNQCLSYCTPPDSTCTGGRTCVGFDPPATIGGTEWGLCVS
ncbi:MAG: hypothetical protein JXB32_13230 [Deltaproteobacteria bacterium]|nr:hypothetical protein [Deltaproteobacteria bacterium]